MKTQRIRITTLLIAFTFFAALKMMAALPDLGWGPTLKTGANLYVASNGDDTNEGTIKAPWKTITKAQTYIRTLKSTDGLPANGITVWLRGGRYELATTLQFTAADNGEADKPIIYRAFTNESVSLFNGKVIQPEWWKPLNKEARNRVHPKVDAANLRELDISTLGVKNAATFADKFINWSLFDFVVDNTRQPIAQWPNLNENIREKNEPGWTTCNGSKDLVSFYYGAGGKPTDNDATNEVDLDGTNRMERWKKSMEEGHNLWLKGFWRIPWEAYTVRVAELNSAETWIKMSVNANQGMGSKYSPAADAVNTYRIGDGKEKWCAINYLDEIDKPGEWAYDFKDKKIYYLPSKNLSKVSAYIADKSQAVVTLTGASNIQFIALTVEGSQGNGFELTNASNVSVSGCTILNVGASGIHENNGKNNTFQSNNIFETGGVGINILNTGNRATLTPSNDKVINNHIHHTGKLTYLYAIFVKNSIGITFANNLIHDIPAGGFSTLLINDCVFENNEIHNIALKVSDMGAYYGYGGWTCYGNEIRYNFVHHSNRANGLYSDDGTSGKNFHHNIVQGAIKPFLFGGGHQNIGRNNLIIDCASSGSVDDRGIARKYFISNNFGKAIRDMKPDMEPWKSYGNALMKTYGYAPTDSLWKAPLDTLWHPEFPNGCKLYDNVEVKGKGFSKSKTGTVTISDNTSIAEIAEAGFKDYLNMDLQTSNAQILSKFPDLNTALPKIGLQLDTYRTRLVTRAETGGLNFRGAAGDKAYEDAVNLPSVNKLPIIADMVHNNPGEAPYTSKFNNPDVIKEMGYNGKTFFIFLSPQLAVNWDKVDPEILPVGSPDRKWVDDKAAQIHTLYSEMKKKDLNVYCMSDLILFPKKLIEKYGMEKTFSDPRDPQTEKYLRILVREMFTQFPELDGIFVRIGETYLHDAPYHKGGIQNQRDPDKTIIPLLNILRDEICVKLNKKLIFRTWWSFDISTDTYMKVSDAVEPHDNLTISIKHCEGDFHRGNLFSKVLGIGRHKQLVEVQCAREYEGKGAYPDYIANGVINGFEEHAALRNAGKIASIKDLADRFPLFKGMWTWSRGGGWEGPYITNELWPELNAYVLSQWANNTNESEETLFNRFATEKLKLSAIDVPKFRKLALLSQEAILRGRRSAAFYNAVDTWWTRDEYISLPKLPKGDTLTTILAEKDTAIVMWKTIVQLAKEIKFADEKTQSFAQVSAEYGLDLYKIYRALFYLSAIKDGLIPNKDTAKWLKIYDQAWLDYEKLKKDHADCPTIYLRDKVQRMQTIFFEPAETSLKSLRQKSQ